MPLLLRECEPGASPFVERYFHDCVYTWKDELGFALGLTSILLWITAQLPQVRVQAC
jgi:hypothetical protein